MQVTVPYEQKMQHSSGFEIVTELQTEHLNLRGLIPMVTVTDRRKVQHGHVIIEVSTLIQQTIHKPNVMQGVNHAD